MMHTEYGTFVPNFMRGRPAKSTQTQAPQQQLLPSWGNTPQGCQGAACGQTDQSSTLLMLIVGMMSMMMQMLMPQQQQQ